jgi:hypothetical protein
MILQGADNSRYFQLKVNLSNDMTKGTDSLPKTIVDTVRLLTNYMAPPRLQRARGPDGKGLAFVQGEGRAPSNPKRDGANKGKINCWDCGGLHCKSECPELKALDEGIQNFNNKECNKEHNLFLADDSYGLVQKQAKGVQSILFLYHAYIDTCPSYASTPYLELLSNLKKELRGLIGHSNTGLRGMDLSGLLGALKQVWLNKGRVATIISLKQLEKLCPVTYDSTHNGGAFVCRTKDRNIVLRNNNKGMPYLDLRESKANAVLSFALEAAQSFVQTVQGNMEGFTRRKVEEAQKARKAQAMLGHPTDRDFLGMVPGGMISNCPVTANTVTNAHQIFGPDLAGVRGRTVRRPLNLSPPIMCRFLGPS